MTQLLQIVQKLTDAERQEVKDFAEFLLTRRAAEVRGAQMPNSLPNSFTGWAGCLAHIHPEKSDAQFNKLILNEWARAAED